MPALPPVAKVIRCDFSMQISGGPVAKNRQFFQYTGALSQADANTLAATISSAWGTNVMAHLSNQVQYTGMLLTDLTSATAPQSIVSAAVNGGSAGAMASAATCIVLKKRIARRYRGGHPRDYIAGIPQGNLADPNTILATVQTQFANDYQAFITAAETAPPAAVGTLTAVSVSYFSGFTNVTSSSLRAHPRPNLRVTPGVDLIIGFSVNPQVGSQRRRNQQSS